MRAQPDSFILVPSFKYIATIPAQDDLVLLQLITALQDLETETNFAYHIKELGWDKAVSSRARGLSRAIANRACLGFALLEDVLVR